jgi:hypothetical protein
VEDLISKDRIKRATAEKGKFDEEKRCFYVQVPLHLGALPSQPPSIYATHVTGSTGDFLVIPPNPTPRIWGAFYDGKVNSNGAAYKKALESIGSVAEVKTGHKWLNKFIAPSNPNRDPRLTYDPNPATAEELTIYSDMNAEILRESKIADACGLKFFLSFSNLQASLSAKELYETLYRRPSAVPHSIPVYRIPYPYP